MKILNFEINNLYDKYSVNGRLDKDVNILVGNNGSFKSTLLKVLAHMLQSEGLISDGIRIESAKLVFDNEIAEHYRLLEGNADAFMSMAKNDSSLTKAAERIYDFSTKNKNAEKMMFRTEQFGYESSLGAITDADDFAKRFNLDIISTFDVRNGDSQKSYLDSKLEKLQSDYSYYLSDLAKQMTDIIGNNGSISKSQMEAINHNKNLMLQYIDKAFSATGKVIVQDSGKLLFDLGTDQTISADKLSSGEKQLLIILLTIMLEKQKPYIVLLDEPEISLHIDWQYELLEWVTVLNPNAQFILTTHSPSIFADGWSDKAIYMEDIVKEN